MLIYSYINTRENWKNSKLCENTPPFGRRVSTQFLIFPISTRVDITVYQHGKCFIFLKFSTHLKCPTLACEQALIGGEGEPASMKYKFEYLRLKFGPKIPIGQNDDRPIKQARSTLFAGYTVKI